MFLLNYLVFKVFTGNSQTICSILMMFLTFPVRRLLLFSNYLMIVIRNVNSHTTILSLRQLQSVEKYSWIYKMLRNLFSLTSMMLLLELSLTDTKIRTRMLKCVVSNRSIDVKTAKCYAKSYSRDFTTINVMLNITRPLYTTKVI